MTINSASFQIVKVASLTNVPNNFPSHVCHYTEDTDKYYIWRNDLLEEIFVDYSTLINNNVINKTYSELVTLKNNNDLIPGASYRITDFQTIYEQPDYALGFSTIIPTGVKMAAIDPIIVSAISENTFSEEAHQESYPLDKLKYEFTHNTFFTNTPTKGRITYRIDEFDNETNYDHRTVLFKRYFKHILNSNIPFSYDSCFSILGEDPLLAYNIITNTPDIFTITNFGSYSAYYCTVSGSRLFGTTTITVEAGDWLIHQWGTWSVQPNSMEFLTFNNENVSEPMRNNKINTGSIKSTEFEDYYFDTPNVVIFGYSDDVGQNNVNYAINTTIRNVFVGNNINQLINCEILTTTRYNNIDRIWSSGFRGGNFINNNIKSIFNSELRGDIENNIGNSIYRISCANPNSDIEIRGNSFIEFREFLFSGNAAQIRDNKVGTIIFNSFPGPYSTNTLNYFAFYENDINFLALSTLTSNAENNSFNMSRCKFNYISHCTFNDSFFSNTGTVLFACNFYGPADYNDFGTYVFDSTFGPNFGYLENYSFTTQGNIATSNKFNSHVEKCNFGANIVNNVFNHYMMYIDIPEGFKSNTVNFLPNGNSYQQQIIFQPELIDKLKVEINGKQLSIINDSEIFNLHKFTSIDVDGELIYWMQTGFSRLDKPYTTLTPSFFNATSTALGSGRDNTIKVAEAENYDNLTSNSCSAVLANNSYLPSTLEMVAIRNWYLNNPVYTYMMPTGVYWTSTEINATQAYTFDFATGNITSASKTSLNKILSITPYKYLNAAVLKYTDKYGAVITKDL
jgi:hypothetical protein